MKKTILFLSLLLLSPLSYAEEPIDSYATKLSEQDHQNSEGKKLTAVGDILRQDRANYHKYAVRDAEDQADTVFTEAKNRERIPAMLKKGKTDKVTQNSILNGTPVVFVLIYKNHIDIVTHE